MALILPLAILAAALAALFVIPEGAPIFGLDHASFARAVGALLILWLVLTGVRRAGAAGVARAIGGAAIWAVLIIGLTGVYAYRFELSDIADRVMAEFVPGEAQVGRGGEVIVNRRLGGEFVIPAKVNDLPVAFLFDTGASTVVLRAQDAAGQDLRRSDRDARCARARGEARRPERKPARHELSRSAAGLFGRARPAGAEGEVDPHIRRPD
jgi:aspartyl protease family protein